MIALALRFWKPLAGVALALALVWAYKAWAKHQQGIGATAERIVWEQKLVAQKAEAATLLDDARKRVGAAEDAAAALRQDQDLKDAQNVQTTADLERKLLTAGRLRDPNATPARCGPSGGSSGTQSSPSASAGAEHDTETPGLLSVDLSALLRTLTREADEINNAYSSSRADAERLRGLLGACGPAAVKP